MPRPKRKSKAPVELHLRVWDARLASFIIDQAAQHKRPMTNQIVFMLEKQMEASGNGR